MKSVREIAEAIDLPVEEWPGKCYGIASAMLRAELVDDESAELRYGHWLGPVSKSCPVEGFKKGGAFQRHGWIEIPEDCLVRICSACDHMEDEHDSGFLAECKHCDCPCFESEGMRIIDPTRWVFEGREPYIYEGWNDHYDAGGNQFRAAMETPCPTYSSSAKRADLAVWKFDRAAHRFVMGELFGGAPGVTFDMAFWLANLALPRLGLHARAIYCALDDGGLHSLIPIDNYRMVTGEEE